MSSRYKEVAYKTGQITEIRQYQMPIFTGNKVSRDSNKSISVSNRDKNRLDVINRKRNTIRRYINTNRTDNDIIQNFTFADNITDQVMAHREFTNFIERLKYNFSNANRYIWAMERHLLSAIYDELAKIHIHVIFFGWPNIPQNELEDIWGLGGVVPDDTTGKYNLGTYFANYVLKVNDNTLTGRTWDYSRNLKKPEKILREYYSLIPEESILFASRPRDNDYYGTVQTLYIRS